MLQIAPIRLAIQDGIFAATQVEVIRGEGGGDQPPYPFVVYKLLLGQKIGRENRTIQTKGELYEQQMELTVSLSCYSNNIGEAETLAYQVLQYFEIEGVEKLQQQNIVVVQTTELTDRTTFVTMGYEYRIGFDVRLRVKAYVVRDVHDIQSIQINEGGV